MHRIPKFFLWLLSLIVPIFIAACYGPPLGYRHGGRVGGSEPAADLKGRVVEAGTGVALAEIDVFCIDRAQQVLYRAMTDATGEYRIPGDMPCAELQFGDGRAARYKPTSIRGPGLERSAVQIDLEPAD